MNRPAKFRQVDVTRALRAAKAAGLEVTGYQIDAEGRIAITTAVGHIPTGATSTVAPGRLALERWKVEQSGKTK